MGRHLLRDEITLGFLGMAPRSVCDARRGRSTVLLGILDAVSESQRRETSATAAPEERESP